jgi:hypothetical protein
MAAAILISAGVGFARTYYLRPWFHSPPLSTLLIVHGTLMSTWILLFAAQTGLITTQRRLLHRQLGFAGALLAVAMVGVTVVTAVTNARAHRLAHEGRSLQFLIVPLVGILLFATFVAVAILLRRHGEAHKRLMLLATLSMLGPAFARWPLEVASVVPHLTVDVLVAVAVLFDIVSRRRVHAVYLLAVPTLIASQPLRFMFAKTLIWLSLADALTH